MGRRHPLIACIIVLILVCLFAEAGAQPTTSVVINEVAWAGTQASAFDEWIELFNNTGQQIDLTSWTIEATDGSPSITLSGTIPANGYFLLERTNDSTISDISADLIYTGSLSNSGESLTLRDALGTLLDTANGNGGSWPAGDNTTKSTMERIGPAAPDTDDNWNTNDGITRNGLDAANNPINGTPKQRNSVAATPTPTSTSTSTLAATLTATPTASPTTTLSATATATQTATPSPTPTVTPTAVTTRSVVINEVAWMGTQASSSDEWIELKNNADHPIDLTGWQLKSDDGSPDVTLAGIIPTNGYFLLERTDDDPVSDITADQIYTGNLGNSGETLTLLDPGDNVVDSANGDGGAWPAGDNATKSSMERVDPQAPDSDSNWTTNDGVNRNGVDADDNPINGTPKQLNSGTLKLTITPTPTSTATPTPTLTPLPSPATPSSVLINEVVTDPQQDWNDSQGGNGVPFDATPGTDSATSTDEWIELLNASPRSIDLTDWSLRMLDTTPATQVLGDGTAVLRFSAGGSLTDFRPGERLVVGNPSGAVNNAVYVQLLDATGQVVDDVEIGDDFEEDGPDGAPGPGQDGNAVTTFDETIARVPDGWDTNNDQADFEKRAATIGADNGRRHTGLLAQLPVLNTVDGTMACDAVVDIQNVGAMPAKAIILFWADAGACPPQCAGPFDVECTGLLKPGASWHLGPGQIPPGARAGLVFSAFSQIHPAFEDGGDVFADALCETLSDKVRDDCAGYQRFRLAFDQRGEWDGGLGYPDFNFAAFPGEPVAVDVTQRCESDGAPSALRAYNGIAEMGIGRIDPLFGGLAYYAPAVYADQRGWNSSVFVQNAGVECTSVELWFKAEGECLRTQVCDIAAVAPGEAYRFDADDCVGPGWSGNLWARSSQPTAIIVGTAGHDTSMAYQGVPAELNYTLEEDTPFGDQPTDPLFTPGSQVNFGPLIYREHQGWDTRIHVQNLSSVLNAKVKVYFLDAGGDVIHSVVDWICPRGSRTFVLAAVNHLPGDWVGQVRVESQDWFAPGDPAVPAPNIVGAAQLVRWSGPAQVLPLEAASYNLLTEEQVFDWQSGGNLTGLRSGAGVIGIPSLTSDAADLTGLTTELAIQNAVSTPGFTDVVLFLYDQNGLVDFVCQKLNHQQVEYVDLLDWGYVNRGFKGSAVISALAWHHEVADPRSRDLTRNLLGLAAVKVERLVEPAAGIPATDASSATIGVPLAGPFNPDPNFGFVDRQPLCPR